MFKMIKGAHVSDSQKISQGYEITENSIIANVDADNIRNMIDGFLDMNNGLPLFLFIEVPANLEDENVIRRFEDGGVELETHHKDVYYLDAISSESLKELFELFYDILINDGLSSFGVGNPYGEEIGKYKYNEIILYGQDLKKYISLFEHNGISRTDKLITAWDTFTENTPGMSEKYSDENNKDVYDIIDVLKEMGIYKAAQREE